MRRQGKWCLSIRLVLNCHAIKGTVANGRFGPDLTHLMSRDTIGAGVMPNTQTESDGVDYGPERRSSRDA